MFVVACWVDTVNIASFLLEYMRDMVGRKVRVTGQTAPSQVMEGDAFKWGPGNYAHALDKFNSVLSVLDVFSPVLSIPLESIPVIGEPLANVISTADDCTSAYSSVSTGATMGSIIGPIGTIVGGAAGESSSNPLPLLNTRFLRGP
eukprot:7801441-Pyramimonas_sp.AAC.1